MTQYLKSFWIMQSDAFRLSFATGSGCLVSAAALALCSTTIDSLHSAQGIALVGGFHFVLAMYGARWRSSSLAVQPIPGSLQNRMSWPLRPDSGRAARGGWKHN